MKTSFKYALISISPNPNEHFFAVGKAVCAPLCIKVSRTHTKAFYLGQPVSFSRWIKTESLFSSLYRGMAVMRVGVSEAFASA